MAKEKQEKSQDETTAKDSPSIFIDAAQGVTILTDQSKTKNIPPAKKIGLVILVVLAIVAIIHYKRTGGEAFYGILSYFDKVTNGNGEATQKQTPPPLIYQGTNIFTTTGWSEKIKAFGGLNFEYTIMTPNLWYWIMYNEDEKQVFPCYPRELDPNATFHYTNLISSVRFKVMEGHAVKTGEVIWFLH